MKIQGKLGFSFLSVGMIFTLLFLTFILLSIRMEEIQKERQRIDGILIAWQDLVYSADQLYISDQHRKVRSEWNRQIDIFSAQFDLFTAEELITFQLEQGDTHYQKIQDLSRTGSRLLGTFRQISANLESPALSFLLEEGRSLSFYYLSDQELEEDSRYLLNLIGEELNRMDIYRSQFISSLLDVGYFIEKEQEQRNRINRQIILLSFALCSAGAFSFALIFSRRMARRLGLVESSIAAVASGDFSVRMDIHSGDEMETLSNHFNDFMTELKDRLAGSLAVMQRVSDDLEVDSSFEEVHKKILAAACDVVQAQCGALLLYQREEPQLKVTVTQGYFTPLRPISGQELFDLPQLDKLFRETPLKSSMDDLWFDILKWRKPLIIKDSSKQGDFLLNDPESLNYYSGLLVLPMMLSGRILGLLAVGLREKGRVFTDLQVNQLMPFADYGALTLDHFQKYQSLAQSRIIEQDLHTAGQIQKGLLPDTLPVIQGFDAAGYSLPSRQVGGDYYDMVPFSSGRFSLFIGDVSGKGISAALGMVVLRTVYHLIASDKRSPSVQLSFLNRALSESTSMDHFATASLMHVLPEEKKIRYSNAAHLPLLFFESFTQKFREIDTDEGIPLGIDRSTAYSNRDLTFQEGDFFVMYTDGINEAQNEAGEQFGVKRLASVLRKNKDLRARGLVDQVKNELLKFCGDRPAHDDQTILIVKYQPKLDWENKANEPALLED